MVRKIFSSFDGLHLTIPHDLIDHELLVVVDGLIKTPMCAWPNVVDYEIIYDQLTFKNELENAVVQLISVTTAIYTDD